MADVDTNLDQNIETPGTEPDQQGENQGDNAEIARLKAELAKAKAATDKATKEAAEHKRALRARQTAEEAAAEAEKERQEAMEKELADLRKERDVGKISKRIMGFIQDEQTVASVAESLYGAADVDAAIDAISKAWTVREKALRQEYGRIPAPGAGNTDGPTITKDELDQMTLTQRVAFAHEHPDEYNKLMGRT